VNDRREGLKKLASHYGLSYMPDRLEDALLKSALGNETQFQHIWPLCQGLDTYARDLLHGPYASHEWTLFDYGFEPADYELHPSIHSPTYGVICARIPCSLPTLHLSPETFLERLGCRLGVHEMTFEVEEFNRRYFVRADDERSAYDILHPGTIDYLLSLPVRDWQIHGCQIVVARNREYSIDEISQVMQEIDGFIRLIPGYVLEDQGFTPDWKGPIK
jgi:hypothetical protein